MTMSDAERRLEELPTPALVIDGSVVGRNLRRLHEYSRQHKLNVRPHTKTHKSREFARLQLDVGAIGLTVAKVGEAQVMSEAQCSWDPQRRDAAHLRAVFYDEAEG